MAERVPWFQAQEQNAGTLTELQRVSTTSVDGRSPACARHACARRKGSTVEARGGAAQPRSAVLPRCHGGRCLRIGPLAALWRPDLMRQRDRGFMHTLIVRADPVLPLLKLAQARAPSDAQRLAPGPRAWPCSYRRITAPHSITRDPSGPCKLRWRQQKQGRRHKEPFPSADTHTLCTSAWSTAAQSCLQLADRSRDSRVCTQHDASTFSPAIRPSFREHASFPP